MIKKIVLLLMLPVFSWGSQDPHIVAQNLGILTLLPPFVAIVLAFTTRQVLVSLFLGLWTGTLLLSVSDGFSWIDIFTSFNMIPKTIVSSLNSSFSAGVIMQVITIGGLIAVIGRTGGARAAAEVIASRAKTARSAQILTWFLGLLIFFEDYASALIAGSVMRPVTDRLNVSREKLAFIVDSTAAPIAAMALISTWIAFELSTMKGAYEIIGQPDTNVYHVFLQTIPYRFYNILMIGFVFIISIVNRDFGPMLKAETRARSGQLNTNDTSLIGGDILTPLPGIKLNIWNAIIPLFVLIIVAVVGFGLEGYKGLMQKNPSAFENLHGYNLAIEILGSSSASFVLFQAALAATLVAFAMGMITKAASFNEILSIWLEGAKNIFGSAGLVLILAWSLAAIVKPLGTNFFLVEILQGIVHPLLLPTLIFIVGMLISFSTGTAYGTMGILMPLAIPLAYSLSNNDPIIMIASSGSVLAGAVFGDHCSPISDTTLLSSVGAGCPMIDHVETQMPYALFVGILAVLLSILTIMFHVPLILSYIIGFSLMILVLFTFGKNPNLANKR